MATLPIERVLDLNAIYNDAFRYSLPREILEQQLAGLAFDNKERYTEEEYQKLCQDIFALYQQVVVDTPPSATLEAVMTAGGPGVGKTRLLQSRVQELKYPYICPDDVCLKKQERTYLADIAACDQSHAARQALYNKWRPASVGAAHLILAHLIAQKLPLCFGTTSSSPMACKLFDLLKKQGYKITLLHVSSPADVCWRSLQERDKTFIQTTEQDIVEKTKLVPQRIVDTFLKYADTLHFYYRDTWDKDAQLAATWIRNPEGDPSQGTLKIVNEVYYNAIKNGHNTIIHELGKEELSWDKTVESPSYSSIEKIPVSVS